MTYNKVIIAGIVINEPEFTMDSNNGDVLHIDLKINRKDIGKSEIVSVSIYDTDLIQEGVRDIHAGDYFVSTNAKITTTNYQKVITVICPQCGDVDYKQTKAEKTEVEILSYELIKNIKSEEAVGINKVFLLGNVCSKLNFRPAVGTNKDYVKYKLAVNRLGAAREIQNADYPFIVSFGKEAGSSNEQLKESSELLIEGSVQQREIGQKVPYHCAGCHQPDVYKAKSYVREIITLKVEYLNKDNK